MFMQNKISTLKEEEQSVRKSVFLIRERCEDISLLSAVLLGESFGYVTICYFNLLITGTGVGELVPTISIS